MGIGDGDIGDGDRGPCCSLAQEGRGAYRASAMSSADDACGYMCMGVFRHTCARAYMYVRACAHVCVRLHARAQTGKVGVAQNSDAARRATEAGTMVIAKRHVSIGRE